MSVPELIARYIRRELVRHIERLLRNNPREQLRKVKRGPVLGTVGEAQLSDKFEEPPPPTYTETGLLTFDGVDCASGDFPAALHFTDDLRTWFSSRQAASSFVMIGSLNTAGSAFTYPPLDPFPGSVDKDEGDSELWLCKGGTPNYALTGHPSSIWSGKFMKLFVQAKYGAGKAVTAGSTAFSVVIEGHELANGPGLCHWIVEHREATRLEWWAISVASGGEMKVAKLTLDANGQTLRDYILNQNITDEADLTWLRTWIFAEAIWPQVMDWTIVEPTMPAYSGLGYGWHVSDSGLLATVHSYELANDGTHFWSDWKRHELTLSLSYPVVDPVWSHTLTETGTGRLELRRQSGLMVWVMTHLAQPALFLTDTRVGPPGDPEPSDAEIFGRYEEEVFYGVSVSDTGTVILDEELNGPIPDCNTTTMHCWGGNCTPGQGSATYTRKTSVDGSVARNGTGQVQREFFWTWTGQITVFPEWQSGGYSNSFCNMSDLEPECPDEETPIGGRWAGTFDVAQQAFSTISSTTEVGGRVLVIPANACDCHLILASDNTTSSATTQLSQTGTPSGTTAVPLNIHSQVGCPISNTWVDAATYEGSPNLTGTGNITQYSFPVYNESGPVARNSIKADLVTPGPNLSLWSSSGGQSLNASSPLLDKYQGSGTMEEGGWGVYFDNSIGVEPSPIYVQRAAVSDIVSACKAPGCAELVATDVSAADPFPTLAVWIGGA